MTLEKESADTRSSRVATQTVVTCSLVVKGEPWEVASEVERRLSSWFQEDSPNDCLPGIGFPTGSLLHYRLAKTIAL